MEEESATLNKTNDTCLNRLPDPHSSIDTLQEPFLHFDENTDLSFEDKSAIFCSLVALVKAEYPFDSALQDRTAQFLKCISPDWDKTGLADTLATELVPSSAGSLSGFVESITTLLSSPHSTVVAAALLLLRNALYFSSLSVRYRLVESDLITKVFATVQPHPLPIAGNETMFGRLVNVIDDCILLTQPWSLINLGITTAIDAFNVREMIFRKVVLPLSQFVTFLISNRYLLNGDLLFSFMYLLYIHIRISQFHRPTLEFVLASPIVMAITSCLSIIEDLSVLGNILSHINFSLKEWKNEGPEVTQSGKRMMQALNSEGFEDILEHVLKPTTDMNWSLWIPLPDNAISKLLGLNVPEE
ncbi:hypothetical protein BLNAU_7232 [Blattamonas nauphoetae]|uniref:Importin N-terminal domain-containing protein n=1 Tax=Blattamonas nauphoetae TaxID=2049346 RepID=A0ABQ9Y228_9EUKA|nr:hypothetical protein BLNAU_7232 [Blattamonas nauphoetae]